MYVYIVVCVCRCVDVAACEGMYQVAGCYGVGISFEVCRVGVVSARVVLSKYEWVWVSFVCMYGWILEVVVVWLSICWNMNDHNCSLVDTI